MPKKARAPKNGRERAREKRRVQKEREDEQRVADEAMQDLVRRSKRR
jgi:hypothetical protein